MSFDLGTIAAIAGNSIPKNNTSQSTISEDIVSGAKTITQKFTPDAQDIKLLLTQSWHLIKDNPSLRAPFYELLKIHISYCFIFYIALSLALFSSFGWPVFILTTIFLTIIWLPVTWFVTTRQQGRMALMIYKTENNESFDTTCIDMEIKQVHTKLREITWASILESTIRASLEGKGGIFSMIVGFLVMAIREVWDLMYNYLIPAVVVEKKESWSEYAENFKKLTQKIPATLIGVFGIDFSEAGVGWLFGIVLFVLFLLGGLVGVGVGYLQILMGWDLGAIFFDPGFAVHPLPIILMSMIVHIILGAKRIAFSMMKTMYFTLLYTSLQFPEIIDKNPALKDYLTLNGKR